MATKEDVLKAVGDMEATAFDWTKLLNLLTLLPTLAPEVMALIQQILQAFQSQPKAAKAAGMTCDCPDEAKAQLERTKVALVEALCGVCCTEKALGCCND